jgi:hypothetical protein
MIAEVVIDRRIARSPLAVPGERARALAIGPAQVAIRRARAFPRRAPATRGMCNVWRNARSSAGENGR